MDLSCPVGWLHAIEDMAVPTYIGNIQALHGCNQILRRANNTRDLRLAGYCFNDRELSEHLNDSAGSDGHLARTLFAHIQPFGNCGPLAPRELDLDFVELGFAYRTFTKCIDFTKLYALRLEQYKGVNSLLSTLATRFEQVDPSLKVFSGEHEIDTLWALYTFSSSFSGLGVLRLILAKPALPYFHPNRALRNHPPIEDLAFVEVEGRGLDKSCALPHETIRSIASEGANIQELAVTLPSISLSKRKTTMMGRSSTQ